jgi:hypothetical protein
MKLAWLAALIALAESLPARVTLPTVMLPALPVPAWLSTSSAMLGALSDTLPSVKAPTEPAM